MSSIYSLSCKLLSDDCVLTTHETTNHRIQNDSEVIIYIYVCINTVFITIINTHEISVHDVEYLLEKPNNLVRYIWPSDKSGDTRNLYKFGYFLFISEDIVKKRKRVNKDEQGCIYIYIYI